MNKWNAEVRDQLFRSVNCISSLRQGNFYVNERVIIQEHWDELISPLGIIVDNPETFCVEQCYENWQREELYRTARKTNKPEDWAKVPMLNVLIDCFNMDCLMHKDYKQAMENLKNK